MIKSCFPYIDTHSAALPHLQHLSFREIHFSSLICNYDSFVYGCFDERVGSSRLAHHAGADYETVGFGMRGKPLCRLF